MPGRPRITWVIPTMRVGGSEIQLIHLMKGLADDFDMSLVCTRSEGALIGDARRSGAHVRVLNAPSGWDFRVQRRLERILRANPPHILHTCLYGFDLFANRAARNAGVPVILSSRREIAAWQRSRHRIMQRTANRYVDAIIANSNAVADHAARQEGESRDRYEVIHNGIEADRFVSTIPREQILERFRLPPEAFIIGMVANFSPVKDHQLFLDMANRLLKHRQDVHFLFVGTGRLVDRIGVTIRRRGQEKYFTRTGSVGEVADLLSAMDVKVLTSKSEGFPNAIIEAMSAGTPCVAPQVGGIPELIRHEETGLLVASRSPEAFASQVGRLLDEPPLRERLAAAAGTWVREHLPLRRMIDAHRELYLDLLQQKLRRGA